ncbi:MAG: hypothetical protein NZM31_00200 [Gemmatales bacterium]|nr:hypothetical protein [Gemmatales bacterium]MDW8385413.1 hypothetical protein [Gemmatales bacterium]
MRSLCVLTVMGIACLLASPLAAQDRPASSKEGDKSLASLVGKETAFYLEVRKPDATAEKLSALLQGSVLENYPAGLEKLRQKGIEPEAWMEFLGLLMTPEGQKEARKLRGLALAVRGPNADGGWDYVTLVQPGDSTALALMLRQYLASQSAQPVEEVEGVAIFRCYEPSGIMVGKGMPNMARLQLEMQRRMMQQMQRMIQRQMPGAAIVNAQGNAVDYVLLPDLIAFGSPALVKESVLLAKGRANMEVLADHKAFADAGKSFGEEAGVFFYGDLSVLESQLSKLEVNLQPAWTAWLRHFAKPSAVTPVHGGLTFDKDGPRVQIKMAVKDQEASPLVSFLPESPANAQLLHYVPSRLEGAILLANPEGQQRWKLLLDVCDAAVRSANPAMPSPSKRIAELEESLKVQFGKDVAGQIKHLVLAQGPERLDGSLPQLLGVFEVQDEETAKTLQSTVLGKILEAVSGQQVVPTIKEAKGRTLTVAELGSLGTIHVGRQGAVLVVGNDQELVLDALTAGERKQGLLGEARVAAALSEVKGAGTVVLARPSLLWQMANGTSFVARLLTDPNAQQVQRVGPFGQVQFQIQFNNAGGAQAILPAPPGAAPAQPGGNEDQGFALAPVLISVTRSGNQVTLDARLTEALPTLPRFLEYLAERGSGVIQGPGPFGGAGPQPLIIRPAAPNIRQAIPAVPAPAVPPLPQPVPIQPPGLPAPPNQIEK